MVSGEYRTELLKEVRVNEDIKQIARKIKKCSNDETRLKSLRKLLEELTARYKSRNINDFTLAIDNRLQLNSFDFEKCKVTYTHVSFLCFLCGWLVVAM